MPDPIRFGEWKPDLSDRETPASEALGVVSVGGQYGPFPEFQNYGGASGIDSSTKILLHFNGPDESTTFDDTEVATPHEWTAAGDAQIDTTQSKFGGASLALDGTGDWITASDHADFTLGAGDWTVDFWFDCTATTGSQENLCGQCNATPDNSSTSFRMHRTTDDVIEAVVCVGSSAFTVTGTTEFNNATNTGFHHVALVRSGDELFLYIDGTEEDSVAITGTVNDSSDDFRIGAAGEVTSNPWTGHIDEFRLSVGVARWTDTFTPPTVQYNWGAGARGAVLGSDTFYDSDTTPQIFYGDPTKLYHLESRLAIDRSKPGGYSVGETDTWQFAQFGDGIFAVSRNVQPQTIADITVANSNFADLAGAPVNATAVARVGDFLMMGKEFTVHWSAFNDPTDWTPDAGTQAGNQVLDQERGEIIAIVGLDYAAIFQERGVRRAIYVGPPVIWDFGQDYVEKARGCIARNAATPFGRVVYYAADDGFYAFDGQQSHPIGYGKVDNYYTRNLNYAYRHKIAVGIDYIRKLAVFGIPTGSSQFISELLIYSIQDGRWTHDEVNLEFLFDSPAEPFTLENISTVWGDDIDDPSLANVDIDSAIWDDRRIRLAGFNTGHELGLFAGPNRPATLDTNEFELSPGTRALLTEIWPVGDIERGMVSAQVGYRRALPGASLTFTPASNMNRAGFCPQRIDARFVRPRLNITAGASWRRMEGIHYKATVTGQR